MKEKKDLSSDYSENSNVVDCKGFSKATFYYEGNDDCKMFIEGSYDKIKFFKYKNPEIILENQTRYEIDIADYYLRISLKGQGKSNLILILS